MLIALVPVVLAAVTSSHDPWPEYVARHIGEGRRADGGSLTWFGLHIYDAALFSSHGGLTARRWHEQAFVLELTYARALDGEAIAERSYDEMERLGAGTEAQRTRWLAQLRRVFPDVTRGSRIAGVNLPGEGAIFYLNGALAGKVADPEFARAFFGIWLDERTREPDLRERLLALPGES